MVVAGRISPHWKRCRKHGRKLAAPGYECSACTALGLATVILGESSPDTESQPMPGACPDCGRTVASKDAVLGLLADAVAEIDDEAATRSMGIDRACYIAGTALAMLETTVPTTLMVWCWGGCR